MLIAIADTHLSALLAMREARDLWASVPSVHAEAAARRAENQAWLDALTPSERSALKEWDDSVIERLAALLATAATGGRR